MPGRSRKPSLEPEGSLFEATSDLEIMAAGPPPAPALPPGMPGDWGQLLAPEFTAPYFRKLQQFLAAERAEFDVYPPAGDEYTALKLTSPDAVRVVILGQDPYPTPGQGHGLAFSVRPGVVIPASLRNIYKELADDLGVKPARHGYLKSWAEQGVLMLNTILTVRANAIKSHRGKGWEPFTDAILKVINARQPVVFLLWGNDAKSKAPLIDAGKHVVLKEVHPSPMSASNGFFGSRPFSRINAHLEALGYAPINWQLPEAVAE